MYPVISLAFANIKESPYELIKQKICKLIAELYLKYDYITKSDVLPEEKVGVYKK